MSGRKSSENDLGPLILRADAGPQMGTGHVMRCLTVAEAWRSQGGQAALLSASLPDQLRERADAIDVRVERLEVEPGSPNDADRIAAIADPIGASWIVEDGYRFASEHQRRLRDCGFRLLWIDDLGRDTPVYADVVVNQNLHASPELYPNRDSETELLLGPRYALLRSEFRERGSSTLSTTPDRVRTLLVTLGGTDTTRFTLGVLDALERLEVPDLRVMVVLGAEFPDAEEAKRRAKRLDCHVDVRQDVRDMASVMAASDAAFAAAGSTIWELLHMGVPCATVAIADNQQPVLEALEERDAVLSLGWHGNVGSTQLEDQLGRLVQDRSLREQLASKGPEIVDGQGVQRVVQRLRGEDRGA